MRHRTFVNLFSRFSRHPLRLKPLLLAALLAATIGSVSTSAAAASFNPKQDFATGPLPYYVAVGDLNGDGRLDLAFANFGNGNGTVSVLLNTTAPGAATASFTTKVDFPVGDAPFCVALGDLNGDGKLDVVVQNPFDNTVSVLLNTTSQGAVTPSFSARQTFPTGVRPGFVAVGDINGDGKLDVIVENGTDGNVSVLLNTTVPGSASANFAPRQNFALDLFPIAIAVADLNGDSKLDLAVANGGGDNVSVLLNTTITGATTVSFAVKQNFATNRGPTSVAAGDLNGDGKLDLALTNIDDNTTSVLLNTTTTGAATPSFADRVDFFTGTRSRAVAVADVSGDGRLDLVVANQGSGVVSVRTNTTPQGSTTLNFIPPEDFGVGSSPGAVAAADLNMDGKLDVVVANTGSQTGSVLLNTAASFAPLASSTGVVSSLNPSNLGQSVTFTATVTVPVGASTPTGTVQFKDGAANLGSPVTLNGSGVGQFVTTALTSGMHPITAVYSGDANFLASTSSLFGGQFVKLPQVSFSALNYSVNEIDGVVHVVINRTGDLVPVVNVDYATADTGVSTSCSALNTGLASSRCDFTAMFGTLKFAANETQKTLDIPISRDSFTEGPETFTINLSNLTLGAGFLTPSIATVTINDSSAPAPNAIDDTTTFVRQQYRDFLNRDADAPGLAFWTGEINNCTPKPQCTELKRTNVSAAFFLSIEFQTTGNLVRNVYVAALNRPATNNMPAFVEFLRDTQAMQRGVIVDSGNNDWQTVLNNNRDAFLADFVTRAEFISLYPTTDTPTQYVDKLYAHAVVTPGNAAERQAAIDEFAGAGTAVDTGARGRALLRITQNAAFTSRERNRSFVQMEYFGYLRRNPNDPPDTNFSGYDFWLNKLNAAGGNFITSDMVKSFLVSGEYRQRFGP